MAGTDRERVVAVDRVPLPSSGATEPVVISNERNTILVYNVADAPGTDPPPELQGVEPTDIVAIVRFAGVRSVYFGAPNDEALDNHPLWGSGLGFYGVYRVESSSWAEAMHELAIRRQPGEKHRHTSPPPKPGLTHYIVTMHDSTFECIASGLTFEVRRQALDDVVAHLAGDLRSA